MITRVSVMLVALASVSCTVVEPARPSHAPPHSHVAPALSVPTEFVGPFGAWGDNFWHWNSGSYEKIFLKGVDLGVGMPGTQPGDLAPSYDDYRRWFVQMDEMGLNCIRIYTMHFPRFYRALAEHNALYPDRPLWVLHGVWLKEGQTNDLHALTDNFRQRIEEAVDAVHGKLIAEKRFGQAYGEYTYDISEWVIGWIAGREVHSEEVVTTDDKHGRGLSYDGQMLSLSQGHAAEVWIAEQLDHLLVYESQRYDQTRPVAFSSWVELDPLTHPTEPWYSGKDIASVDLYDLDVHGAQTGSFISYHAYPYFPHFINDDPDYAKVADELGANPYLGYLRDLAEHYEGRPLLISEFGLPSSWGNAKLAGSGMHHGGHTERDQALYARRMVDNIHSVGAAGAIWFHWMDGWFKQVWITENRTFPNDRLRLWHDLMNPQQSYGLISFDPTPVDFTSLPSTTGDDGIREIALAADAQFLHVRVTLADSLRDGQRMLVAL